MHLLPASMLAVSALATPDTDAAGTGQFLMQFNQCMAPYSLCGAAPMCFAPSAARKLPCCFGRPSHLPPTAPLFGMLQASSEDQHGGSEQGDPQHSAYFPLVGANSTSPKVEADNILVWGDVHRPGVHGCCLHPGPRP